MRSDTLLAQNFKGTETRAQPIAVIQVNTYERKAMKFIKVLKKRKAVFI